MKSWLWVLLGFVLCFAMFWVSVFWVYGVETRHSNRTGIWWPERGRNLIPPDATDIRLQRDVLDHYACYSIDEKDLVAFLSQRFATGDGGFDVDFARGTVDEKIIGGRIGRLNFLITETTVLYACHASNGGMHRFYHDPATDKTFQSSAYW
ncbi:hypothetical protein OAL35_01410 [bacterium]|nr:hypothetical protein [bacterium]